PSPLTFSLTLNSAPVAVSVDPADTLDNLTVADLVADLQAAVDAATPAAGDVIVSVANTGEVTFAAKAGKTLADPSAAVTAIEAERVTVIVFAAPRDITTAANTTATLAAGDYDDDGDLDVIAGNDGQPNVLYRNNGRADDPFAGFVPEAPPDVS